MLVTDGILTLRPLGPTDLEQHLSATDDAQMDWLWDPGDRERYESFAPEVQRANMLSYLTSCQQTFGPGPKWVIAADLQEQSYVVYVDCDLGNPELEKGQANISYACHPAYRGRGLTTRAVLLACTFLRDQTDAEEAHLVVHQDNAASRAVATAAGAKEIGRYVDRHGRPMVRHVVTLR